MSTMAERIAAATSASEYSNLLASDQFGIYPAKAYLQLDGVTDDYSALYDLINTTIDGEDAEIHFKNGTCLIGASITIPSNVKLVFLKGGALKPESGVTITGSNTSVIAGIHQIFDTSSGGTIAGTWDISDFCAQHFGAAADGVTDDSGIMSTILTLYSGKTIDLKHYTLYLGSAISIPIGTTLKNATFVLDTDAYLHFNGRYAQAENVSVTGLSGAYANIGFLITDYHVKLKNVKATYCEKGYSIDTSIGGFGFWGASLNGFSAFDCNTGLSIYCADGDWMTGFNFTDGVIKAYEYGVKIHRATLADQVSHFNFNNIIIDMAGGKSYTTVYGLYVHTAWSNYNNIEIFNDFGPDCYGLYIVRTTVATSIIGGYQNNAFANMTIEGQIDSNDMFYCNKISNVTWLNKTWQTGIRSRDRIADYPKKLYTNKDISALHASTTAAVSIANGEIEYTNSSGGTVSVAVWIELPKALTNLFIKSNYIQARILFEIYDSGGVIETNVAATSYITSDNTTKVVATGAAVDVASDDQGQLKAFSYNMADSAEIGELTRDAVSHIRFVIPVADTLSLTIKNIELYNHLCLVNGMDDQEDYISL